MSDGENMGSRESILVIGGGISGITTAIETAEVGHEVFLVERNPYLGGRVIRTNEYFPKLCPPYCGMEINFKRIKANPRIQIYTQAEVESISGQEGDFDVTINITPRLVNDNCTACGKCAEVCPVERPNDINFGLDQTKAIYLPNLMAYPMQYVIDSEYCSGAECAKCVSACEYDAINLDMPARKLVLKVGAIVAATGWNPYDATKIGNLHFGEYPNVITNVMMERLASSNGPTGGRILRPSDQKEISSIAFAQCAGSRDENHRPYCSAVCCLASLKQALYVNEQYPDAKIFIFYIDIRAPGYLEDFYRRVQDNENVSLIKGKVARISEDAETKDLIVEAEDTVSGKMVKEKVEMVVLATGMVPTTEEIKIPAEIVYDSYGFITSEVPGVYAAGCSKRPVDVATSVRDATGAALKAIQSVAGGGKNG